MARMPASADAFNAMGDPCRRRILGLLAGREATVGEVVTDLEVSQPQVSKHLRVLRDAGLVRCRAEGRHRLYRVHPPALVPLRSWLDELAGTINAQFDRLDDHLHDMQANPRE
jgi:DNA-binding transcriptional ArsR family regulator